jgi:hypothetical protein
METFNHQKLNDVQVKEQYQVNISNRFAPLKLMMMMWTSKGLGKVLEKI